MPDPHTSQVRIGHAQQPGHTVGCGLLVTPTHVVTCAHVVADALGEPALAFADEPPPDPVPLDLPLLAAPFATMGRVVCWRPARDDGTKVPEDIAVLALAEPAPDAARPAPLRALAPADYNGLHVHCFGFPAGVEEGVRRTGTCRGENALGRVQLDIARGLVEGGFSGTAAWDSGPAGAEGAAVGLVVAARTEDQSAQLIPVRTLFAACPELDRTWRPRNPYKGLAAFQPADRADFFGRAEPAAALAARVGDARLTTLLGPSGSGKSSLIGAGLLPLLADQGGWRVLRLRPGADPVDALAGALIPPDLTTAQRVAERRRLTTILTEGAAGVAALLREWLAGGSAAEADARLLLIVDQFEELFTHAEARDAGRARAFATTLAALAAGDPAPPEPLPLHLLLALRADFMGRAMDGPAAALVAAEQQFQVSALDGEQLRAAIEGPAAAQGVRFGPGVTESMRADLADQPGRLPLLQFALTALWDQQQARVIDAAALARIGGVRRALADYADGVIDALSEADRSRARRVLVQLVRPAERDEDAATRQVASLRRIPEQDQDLLPRLAQSRLIVTGRGGDDGAATQPIAELAHEALIREWPRLATWVAEDRAFRLWQEGLRSRMGEWDAHARAAGYLLSGPPLAEAEGRLAAAPEQLGRDDIDYITASRRRARRNRRLVAGGSAGVMLALAALAGVGLWQRQVAVEQERAAVAAAERATRAREEAERLVNYITFDLRGKLKPFGRLDLLADTYEQVHAYYADIIRRRASNYIDQADAAKARGDLAGAEAHYAEASMLLAELADAAPDNLQRQRDLSVSLERIGDTRAAQGDLAGALAAFERSLAIRERLTEADPSNAGWQRDLSVSLNKLGDTRAAQGDLAGALAAFEQDLAIAERLAEADPSNAQWQTDVVVAVEARRRRARRAGGGPGLPAAGPGDPGRARRRWAVARGAAGVAGADRAAAGGAR